MLHIKGFTDYYSHIACICLHLHASARGTLFVPGLVDSGLLPASWVRSGRLFEARAIPSASCPWTPPSGGAVAQLPPRKTLRAGCGCHEQASNAQSTILSVPMQQHVDWKVWIPNFVRPYLLAILMLLYCHSSASSMAHTMVGRNTPTFVGWISGSYIFRTRDVGVQSRLS